MEKKDKVIKFLNKTYNELLQEQSFNQKQIDTHEAKIKEMHKAIKIAEEEIDPNYNLFSPKKSGKIKMNDTLSEEVHVLENELEELKFKKKKLADKIENTKDILECIIGKPDDDLFETNSLFLDALIEEENKINNDNYNEESDNDDSNVDDGNDVNRSNENVNVNVNGSDLNDDEEITDSDDGFEIVTEEIEDSKEYIFDDEIRKNFINIQENEKNRIARELHDTTVQNLTGLVHKSELCMKLVDVDPIRTKLELQTIMGTLKDSINELRHIIYGLKPMSLDDFGLIITVKKFIAQLNLEDGPNFHFETDGHDKMQLSQEMSLTIFRIIQEACNNARKHSNAKNVDILIDFMDDCINVIIEDDGVGFDHTFSINESNGLSGFGISIMKERAYLLSGKLIIDYSNEKEKTGTKIVVIIPLQENAEK